MRRRYLVTYDVADAKRLRRTYKAMHGFGDPVQYSVFLCDLSAVEKQLLLERLHSLLNWGHDRVLIVDLGDVGGLFTGRIEVFGVQLPGLTDDYGATII
ncbi:CRISPR-associated endonuclease Cas2 [Gemmatimonas sp.]|jgi:CRISPR-associated protein Cas2|uniref:CRISPR-associated endonuclease Cas2 n=1 Tax=Gemmatimonas sp. TaxID=1962908 RepID=UPI0037BEB63E